MEGNKEEKQEQEQPEEQPKEQPKKQEQPLFSGKLGGYDNQFTNAIDIASNLTGLCTKTPSCTKTVLFYKERLRILNMAVGCLEGGYKMRRRSKPFYFFSTTQ